MKFISGAKVIEELGEHIAGKGSKALIVTDQFMVKFGNSPLPATFILRFSKSAGMFTVPGDGDVDFAPIFDIVNASDYDGWYIVEAEQDPAKANPLEYAIKARKYIREKAHI